jgi:hypothetical protein
MALRGILRTDLDQGRQLQQRRSAIRGRRSSRTNGAVSHMALRVGRGLFRLWLVLSVLWIGGVGVVTWRTFPVIPEWAVVCERPFDPDAFLADKPQPPCTLFERVKAQLVDDDGRAAIQSAILLAFLPPAFVLALGSALVWAIRGFR